MKILGGLYTTGGVHTHTLATRQGKKNTRKLTDFFICI